MASPDYGPNVAVAHGCGAGARAASADAVHVRPRLLRELVQQQGVAWLQSLSGHSAGTLQLPSPSLENAVEVECFHDLRQRERILAVALVCEHQEGLLTHLR